MARYSLYMLKVPLNTKQTNKQILAEHSNYFVHLWNVEVSVHCWKFCRTSATSRALLVIPAVAVLRGAMTANNSVNSPSPSVVCWPHPSALPSPVWGTACLPGTWGMSWRPISHQWAVTLMQNHSRHDAAGERSRMSDIWQLNSHYPPRLSLSKNSPPKSMSLSDTAGRWDSPEVEGVDDDLSRCVWSCCQTGVTSGLSDWRK